MMASLPTKSVSLPLQPCQDLWAGTHSFEDRYRKFMDHHRLTGSYWSPGIKQCVEVGDCQMQPSC